MQSLATRSAMGKSPGRCLEIGVSLLEMDRHGVMQARLNAPGLELAADAVAMGWSATYRRQTCLRPGTSMGSFSGIPKSFSR